MTYSDHRELREQAWRMFGSRVDNGGATDNNASHHADPATARERGAAARFPTHAHWRLENTMAKTP